MPLDETGLLVKLEANVAKWEKDFNRAIVQQQRSAKRMEQIAKQNANKIASEYEGIGGRIGKSFSAIPASLKGLGGAFLGGLAGGIAIGGIDQIARGIANTAKETANFRNEAEKAGVSVETWQEWKFVADQNRVSIEALTDGMKELHIRAGEFFQDGTGAGAAAFTKLGYSADQLKTKLKDPSALMSEILGKLQGFDQASRSFLLEEIFGGAGEQFGTLSNQGQAALNATIARAHDVGAVMDSEMIDKAAEIDRRFAELTSRVDAFGKRVVVSFADAAIEAADLRAKLDELFTDEREGRSIVGDQVYDALDANRDLVDQEAANIQHLKAEFDYLGQEAINAANGLAQAADQLAAMGYADQAQVIRDYADGLRQTAQDYASGKIEAQDFATEMQNVQTQAEAAFATLQDGDGVSFAGVRNELGRVGGVIASVTAMANDLTSALARAAGTDAGSRRSAAADRKMQVEQESVDRQDAAREATERFTEAEARRNAQTREQIELERALGDVRKRAQAAGATLSDADANQLAQAQLAGDAARAAAEKAGRAAGGGGAAGGKSSAEKVSEFQREAQAIRDRTMALETEAAVMLAVAASGQQMANASAFAATKAALLTAAQQSGMAITPQLEQQVDALAQSYAKAGDAAQQAGQKMEDANESASKASAAQERGADDITGVFMAAREGSEEFANSLRNLADQLLSNVFKQLIMGFAQSGAPGSGFVGALGGALGGFAEGGFTGPGTKYQPAGVVHAGEFVFSAETVKRIGADNLDAMHSAAKRGATGYSSGGLVSAAGKVAKATGASHSASEKASAPAITLSPTINVNASGGTPEANADLARQVSRETERSMRGLIRDELVKQMRPGAMLR